MNKKNNKLEVKRHSFAHVLMHALENLYGAIPGVGPVIENGFYHDFDIIKADSKLQIREENIKKIEKEMRRIIRGNVEIKRKEMPIDEGIELLKQKKYKYTEELAQELKDKQEKKISFYEQGDFINMCKGPHVDSTEELNPDAFKLTKIAGAYWRGDEKNEMIQRIYGVAFETKEELVEYLAMIEEAKKRDHRKLGKELDLFSISQKIGQGLILWHPKLAKAREAAESFWRKLHRIRGYDTVYTPHIGKAELWQTSGHLDFFRDSMYPPFRDPESQEEYFIKPMNCPFHVEIYKSRPRSYKEFPLRWNELGTVYRYEQSGELSGMLRVRGFTQDDAHVICREDQFVDEYREILKFTLDMYEAFGFKRENVKGYIAIRDPKLDKYAGTDEIWKKAEKTVQQVVEEFNIPHEIEEGGAKFYGPALDLKIKDAIGREWQLTTIQLDFNLPEKFKMVYDGPNGEEQPIMIHRALLGSWERFFAILIEHYGGKFPLWLAPVQVKILPIGEGHREYAREVFENLRAQDFRVEIDNNDETLGKKIRNCRLEKVPYFIVIGDKEVESQILTLESRDSKDAEKISVEDLIKKLTKLTTK